jgi:hypothetical protein
MNAADNKTARTNNATHTLLIGLTTVQFEAAPNRNRSGRAPGRPERNQAGVFRHSVISFAARQMKAGVRNRWGAGRRLPRRPAKGVLRGRDQQPAS